MTEHHLVLISISIDLMGGLKRLRQVVQDLGEIGKIQSTSSIYKKYLNRRSEDLNSQLELVLKMETNQSEAEIFRFLKSKQKTRGKSDFAVSENLTLLTFDQQVRLLPGQNLPSPLFHTDRLTLRCASEAWGSYEHPVLGQTLNELVKSDEGLNHVEFFAQGKSLF